MRGPPSLFEIPLPSLFLGSYVAEVISLKDPDNLARVKVRLLNVDGVADQDAPVWARVAAPFAGNNRGTFFIPDIGDEVLVTFLQGDSRFPIVIGGLWNGTDRAPASIRGGRNLQKVIRSKNGVKLTLDDSDGQEKFIAETPAAQRITLKDGPGAVLIEDANGNSIKLESTGITISAASKVTVNAPTVTVTSGNVKVDAATAVFSGVVQCNTLIASTVTSDKYSPGAGNVW